MEARQQNMPTREPDLQNRFGYHPATPDNAVVLNQTREIALEFAIWIDEHAPAGREKSLAWTALEEVMFWTNAAISRQYPLATDPLRARE